MKFTRTALVFGLILVLTSCSSRQKKAEAEFAGREYAGIIPCADCEGIAYRISFYANSRFESSSMYIGKSNKEFRKEGFWKLKNDSTIVLQPKEGEDRHLRIKQNNLVWLDNSGNKIEGDLASRYVLRNTKEHPLKGKVVEAEKDSPVDFKAHGNEPFWGLEINFKKKMTFNVLDGDSITTPVPQAGQDSASGVRIYNAGVESGSLAVELYPVGCMDSMSGLVYDYRVMVTMNGEEYSGCGGFVTENHIF